MWGSWIAYDVTVVLLEHEVGSLAFEFSRKGTALFGHLTPRSGEHSRLNGCPVSLDHYSGCRLCGLMKLGGYRFNHAAYDGRVLTGDLNIRAVVSIDRGLK
jgi:hypothetical protein